MSMCDNRKEKKCGGGPPTHMPGWMKCPPKLQERNYPAPAGVDILPISVGGRNGAAAPNSVKCGKCGDSANTPPAKPKASADCPMMRPRCPGSEKAAEKDSSGGGSFFAKIASFFGGKGDSKLVEACRKMQIENEQIGHHRDVFDPQLIVRKDGYMSPFMTKVDCQGSNECDPCSCQEDVEEEEECEEEEEEEEECEEEDEEEAGVIEIDGCKCTCECPEEEEECVQDAEGECIIEESSECMDPACKFFLEDPEDECGGAAEKKPIKKKKCDDFSKVGADEDGKNQSQAMNNFIIRVQAPFSDSNTNETCEQILERLTKRPRTIYKEPQKPEKKPEKEEEAVKEVELVVKQISVEEPSLKKPKKKCKKKVDECKAEPPPKKEEECPQETNDAPCPCGNPPLPPGIGPDDAPCPQPPAQDPCAQPPGFPPQYGMPGYPYPPPPPGAMPGYGYPPPPAYPQPEGMPYPPAYPYPPYGMYPPMPPIEPVPVEEPPKEEPPPPPPPPQNDCETLTEEELLKKPLRDIKCGCPKECECPDTSMCSSLQMSVWTPPPPPPCPACGAEERGSTENCFLCSITRRMRSGNPEFCTNDAPPLLELIKPSPDDLCAPTYLDDGSILYKGGMCLQLANQFLWHVVKKTTPGGFFDRFVGACGEEERLKAISGPGFGEDLGSKDSRPPYEGGMSQQNCNYFLWEVSLDNPSIVVADKNWKNV